MSASRLSWIASGERAAASLALARGLEDLPTASGYLLAYLVSDEESIAEKIDGLGIKQREFRQLIDTLVLRGYITRETDPANGAVSLALTERGRAASEATSAGVSFVDQELERRLSEAELAGLRRGLAALGEIKQSLAGPVLRRGLPQ
jgi:DNA-binding MarR family transcriptional regulator